MKGFCRENCSHQRLHECTSQKEKDEPPNLALKMCGNFKIAACDCLLESDFSILCSSTTVCKTGHNQALKLDFKGHNYK